MAEELNFKAAARAPFIALRYCNYVQQYILVAYSAFVKVLLGAFAKLQKKKGLSARQVCLSVRTEQLGSHWTYFQEIRELSIFRKYVEKIRNLIKI